MISDRPGSRATAPLGDLPVAAIVRDRLWEELAARADADYPREACGFLVGRLSSSSHPLPVVEAIVPSRNVASDPTHRFETTPEEGRRVDEMMSNAGRVVVGAYHSHPDAPSLPSALDQERAWPGFLQLIVSIRADRSWDGRLFAIDPDTEQWREVAQRGTELRPPPPAKRSHG